MTRAFQAENHSFGPVAAVRSSFRAAGHSRQFPTQRPGRGDKRTTEGVLGSNHITREDWRSDGPHLVAEVHNAAHLGNGVG